MDYALTKLFTLYMSLSAEHIKSQIKQFLWSHFLNHFDSYIQHVTFIFFDPVVNAHLTTMTISLICLSSCLYSACSACSFSQYNT